MSEKQWLWQDENTGGVVGVIADLDEQKLSWFDEPGCACGDSSAIQSFTDFLNKGANYLSPPSDIVDEMCDVLSQVVESA